MSRTYVTIPRRDLPLWNALGDASLAFNRAELALARHLGAPPAPVSDGHATDMSRGSETETAERRPSRPEWRPGGGLSDEDWSKAMDALESAVDRHARGLADASEATGGTDFARRLAERVCDREPIEVDLSPCVAVPCIYQILSRSAPLDSLLSAPTSLLERRSPIRGRQAPVRSRPPKSSPTLGRATGVVVVGAPLWFARHVDIAVEYARLGIEFVPFSHLEWLESHGEHAVVYVVAHHPGANAGRVPQVGSDWINFGEQRVSLGDLCRSVARLAPSHLEAAWCWSSLHSERLASALAGIQAGVRAHVRDFRELLLEPLHFLQVAAPDLAARALKARARTIQQLAPAAFSIGAGPALVGDWMAPEVEDRLQRRILKWQPGQSLRDVIGDVGDRSAVADHSPGFAEALALLRAKTSGDPPN